MFRSRIRNRKAIEKREYVDGDTDGHRKSTKRVKTNDVENTQNK